MLKAQADDLAQHRMETGGDVFPSRQERQPAECHTDRLDMISQYSEYPTTQIHCQI